jgi:hypothetical protein
MVSGQLPITPLRVRDRPNASAALAAGYDRAVSQLLTPVRKGIGAARHLVWYLAYHASRGSR